MKDPTLFRRYAAWGLALGVIVACGTQDNTPPSSYGYLTTDDGGAVAPVAAPAATSPPAGGDMSGSSGSSSGSQSGPGNSSGSSSGGGPCSSSCQTAADCSGCSLPSGASKNCCVMGLCVAMTACPVIRDSGHDGS
jgi:hypothetical protein